ncbi:MAG: transglycosylase domain-containing protein [Actinomycetota bacterium]
MRWRPVGFVLSFVFFTASCGLVPSLDEVERAAPSLPQTTMVFSTGGEHIVGLHAEENRVPISIRRIPKVVQDAVVAIEDQRFWQHRGVDLKALIRAAYVNATTGTIAEGGSTITQQYVKNALLGREQTLTRKIAEASLALQLEKRYSKPEILEKYLNAVYFGEGAYGIRAAAKKFFRKRVEDLTLPEAALLAGLIKSPETFDPVDNPDSAIDRRERVLERMYELGMISEATLQLARAEPLGVDVASDSRRYEAAYFIDYLKRWVLESRDFGETYTQRYSFLFEGGYRIDSTVDLRMQEAAEQAIANHLGYEGAPSAALVAINPRNGFIKALVGGRDYFASEEVDRFAKVNLATGGITGRQTGSAFKVFTLATAIEQGISLSSVFGAPSTIAITDPQCQGWAPSNYGGADYGALSLLSATASSVNTVFAQLVVEVGPENVVDMAHRLGITSPLEPFCSITLGAQEVSPLQMATAFATLAARGVRRLPSPIAKITDRNGEVVMDFSGRKGRRVVEPYVADQVVYALQRVTCCGTGRNAYLGPFTWGKTGTTDDNADVYFCGATALLVACIWVGYPEGRIETGLSSGTPAAIWADFMRIALEGKEVPEPPAPEEFTGVVIRVGPSPSPSPSPKPRRGDDRPGGLPFFPSPSPSPPPSPDPTPEPEPSPTESPPP